MRLETIRRYAQGKSPLVGVPIFSVADGKYRTAVFWRSHLQAFAGNPHLVRASYDEETATLVLSGGKHASYRLYDLRAGSDPNSKRVTLQAWQIRDELTKWANGRRKSAISRALPENERKAVKLRLEVGKLERARDKIRLYVPFSPLLSQYPREIESESARKSELCWREEKPVRRALGQLVRRERKTWEQFYDEVERIVGRTIDASRRHDRVCGRKRGPSKLDYLKYIYTYVGMSERPFRSDWNPYKKWVCGGAGDAELNSFERHRRAQQEYLAARSERAAIQDAINNLNAEIAELLK